MTARVRYAKLAAFGATLALAGTASAAPPYVDRGITLPRHVFAFDGGIGVGHQPAGPRNFTGPGLNLEGAFGVTHDVQLSLRTGIRMGDDGRAIQADRYARTLFTETWGTNGDVIANPELGVRWRFVEGRVVEIGLDGRAYLPIEQGSNLGVMFGVPFAFHIGDSVRIDLGVYMPVVFGDGTPYAISVPAYFWFQTSNRLWLGPMLSVRHIDPGPGDGFTDVLLGFGLGYQVASWVDLKTMILFPRINQDEGARTVGAGFGVQLRIE